MATILNTYRSLIGIDVMKAEPCLKFTDTQLNLLIELAAKTPVLAFIGERQVEIANSITLLCIDIKRLGKRVFFHNLDEHSSFASILPKDTNPDVIILYCHAKNIELLRWFPEHSRTNVLLLTEDKELLKQSFIDLSKYPRQRLQAPQIHCLGINFTDKQFGSQLINNIDKVIDDYIGPTSLSCLGFAAYNNDIAIFSSYVNSTINSASIIPSYRLITAKLMNYIHNCPLKM